jgi:hypothetical protein
MESEFTSRKCSVNWRSPPKHVFASEAGLEKQTLCNTPGPRLGFYPCQSFAGWVLGRRKLLKLELVGLRPEIHIQQLCPTQTTSPWTHPISKWDELSPPTSSPVWIWTWQLLRTTSHTQVLLEIKCSLCPFCWSSLASCQYSEGKCAKPPPLSVPTGYQSGKATYLEEDKDEKQLINHTNAEPKPPISYKDKTTQDC